MKFNLDGKFLESILNEKQTPRERKNNNNKSMILCSHAYLTLEGLSVLRSLHYGASLFSDLAETVSP